MFYFSKRENALHRTATLLEQPLSYQYQRTVTVTQITNRPQALLSRLLYEAGSSIPASVILALSLTSAALCAALASLLVSPYAVLIYTLIGLSLPFAWLNTKAQKRAQLFAEDYPTVLLAMASSLKVGRTPIDALQRAIQLLAKESLVAVEVQRLLEQLHAGLPRQQAIAQFANSIRLPDLELFRTAFLIVLENGGQFAHTLQRLSDVSRDRSSLIKTARVTTVTMRMTANFLLAIAPLLLAIIAMRSKDFWTVFTQNHTANAVATVGLLLITASYLLLRKMSAFKP